MNLNPSFDHRVQTTSPQSCSFFCGRIYNRSEIVSRYLESQSNDLNDSELVYQLYKKLGKDLPRVLVGDFAFSIFDEKRDLWFAARDPMGIVPLYYGKTSCGAYIFSSEINRIRSRIESQSFNFNYIGRVLIEDYADQESTSYEGVFRLQGGHALTIRDGQMKTKRYWLPDDETISYKDKNDYLEHFRNLFFDVLKSRLKNETSGVFLSGGMDSSAIACSMDKLGLDFESLSLQFSKDTEQEKENLRQVLEEIRVSSHVTKIHSDLPQLNDNIKDPDLLYSPGLYFLRVLTDEARRRNLKIAVMGLGGDDVYSLHVSYVADLMKKFRVGESLRELRLSLDEGDSMLRFGLQYGLFPLLPNSIYRTAKKFLTPKGRSVLDSEFERNYNIYEQRLQAQLRIRDYFDSQRSRNIFWRLFQWGGYSFGLEHQFLLSRHEGCEFQYPLMDQRLIEFAMKLPIEYLTFNGEDKIILRNAMKGIVPASVVQTQSVQNYHGMSRVVFLRQRERFIKLLRKSKLVEAGVLNREVITNYRENLEKARCDNMEQLAMILHFEKILSQGE